MVTCRVAAEAVSVVGVEAAGGLADLGEGFDAALPGGAQVGLAGLGVGCGGGEGSDGGFEGGGLVGGHPQLVLGEVPGLQVRHRQAGGGGEPVLQVVQGAVVAVVGEQPGPEPPHQ